MAETTAVDYAAGVAGAYLTNSERNMADRYTKIILTIIALSLAAHSAVEIAPSPAKAQGAGCGGYDYSPCYVKIVG